MKKLTFGLFVLMLALLLLPGTQAAQAASSPLSGTSWVLSSLNGQLPLPGTPVTPVTLQFEADSSASGSDG
jgi:heat shock protein HslJ